MTMFYFFYIAEIFLLLFLCFFIGYVIREIALKHKRKKAGDYAPFVALPSAIVGSVVEALRLHDGAVFYDLGCGDGRIVRACSRAYPGAHCIGVERDWLPYRIAVFLTARIPKEKLQILKKDIFDQDLSDATHIFTYLFPELLDNLLPKLERELQKGTRLVSVDFTFSHKEPEQVIVLDRPSWKLGKKIYVYRF